MGKKRITKIDAMPVRSKKLRVAAYCRISTLNDNQLSSIENQREHYAKLISKHEGWQLEGIYIDEGITGTKKDIRPELNHLMKDCKEGRIDLVLTKSISRFARNTTDCLQMVRELTRAGVNIFFEKENIDTRQMESEFILTILSSLAEEESHSISDNENWRFQKQFENGTFRYKKAPYGFQLKDGNFVIDPIESEVVKWMFAKVLEGKGTAWIAKELNKHHISSPEGKTWQPRAVARVIQNPAAIGDVLLKKTYKDENFKVIRNLGEKPQYYVDHHHEPIIDEEIFNRAQLTMDQRGKEKGNGKLPVEKRFMHESSHANRYPLTGKVICGDCGSVMVRTTQYLKEGRRIHYECPKHQKDKEACKTKQVLQENILNAFTTMLYKLTYAPEILDWYCENSADHKRENKQNRLNEISQSLANNAEKQHRLTLLLASECGEPILIQKQLIELQTKASMLINERYHLIEPSDDPASLFRRFLHDWQRSGENIVTEERMAEQIDQVIVHSQTCFTFCLKCGLKLKEGK